MGDPAHKLHRLFYPRAVAVVGAKRVNNYSWLRNHINFSGPKYHVNTDESEWPGAEELGYQNFRSVRDIPGPVDYVTITVPNTVVPYVMQDCAAKGVTGVHIFATGFAEIHTDEGIRLEESVKQIAQEGNIQVLGPNCMGIFHPKVGIRQNQAQDYGFSGFLGYISQSGTGAIAFSHAARAAGIAISKSVSFGNGAVVDCTDILEYLGQDDETQMIAMYLEGVRDGRRFFETLREAARRKPVLVWKVGQTEDGARAGLAHTGSIPIATSLWDAILRQCGAITVDSMDELLDTGRALLSLPKPVESGALITVSGGHSGQIADAFGRYFRVPALAPVSMDEIASYSDLRGGSFANPFEGPSVRGEDVLARTLGVLQRDPNIDFIVQEIAPAAMQRDPAALARRIETLQSVVGQDAKPLFVLLATDSSYTENPDLGAIAREFIAGGIPCLLGMERTARALRRAADYYRRRASDTTSRSDAV